MSYSEDKVIQWTPSMMMEITIKEPDDFLRIRETLTRIGISAKREHNVLYQSCHILHKQGHYFIVHFKEMFLLDGKYSDLSETDMGRRNTITQLLSDWGLLDIVDPAKVINCLPVSQMKIISHKEKTRWELKPKYCIGNSKGRSYS